MAAFAHVRIVLMILKLATALLMSLSVLPALAAEANDTGASDAAALRELRQEIVQLIGEPRCANLVHCRVLPLGSRPCGGPAEYLAYSSITANREILEAKAYEYGFLQEEMQQTAGAVGVCEVLPEPRVACIDGRCRAGTERP
jgi:hypothetical protein